MDRERLVAGLAAAMVLLGTAQAGYGLRSGDLWYAALGGFYAALGAVFYLAEG
ncbi:MAG: hypothetical protein V5A23_03415 [Halobacteriales archaeon]